MLTLALAACKGSKSKREYTMQIVRETIPISIDYLPNYSTFSISKSGLFYGLNNQQEKIDIIDLRKKTCLGEISLDHRYLTIGEIQDMKANDTSLLIFARNRIYSVSEGGEFLKIKSVLDSETTTLIFEDKFQLGKNIRIRLFDNMAVNNEIFVYPAYSYDYLYKNNKNKSSHNLAIFYLNSRGSEYSPTLVKLKQPYQFDKENYGDLEDTQVSLIDNDHILYSFRSDPILYVINITDMSIYKSHNVEELKFSGSLTGKANDNRERIIYLANSRKYYVPRYHSGLNVHYRVYKEETDSNSLTDWTNNFLLIYNENLDLVSKLKLPKDLVPDLHEYGEKLIAPILNKDSEDFFNYAVIDLVE